MSTCNKIYRQFIKGMAEKVYSKYVYLYCSQACERNDIQLVQQYKFMQELSTGRYSPFPFWECKTENNVTVFVKGYSVSDGGLPRQTLGKLVTKSN
jgi:hypothetical protein